MAVILSRKHAPDIKLTRFLSTSLLKDSVCLLADPSMVLLSQAPYKWGLFHSSLLLIFFQHSCNPVDLLLNGKRSWIKVPWQKSGGNSKHNWNNYTLSSGLYKNTVSFMLLYMYFLKWNIIESFNFHCSLQYLPLSPPSCKCQRQVSQIERVHMNKIL